MVTMFPPVLQLQPECSQNAPFTNHIPSPVPLVVMLASTNPKKFQLSRMLNPAKYAETAGMTRMQPYDPNKIVVLVIHGLMDTPATWATDAQPSPWLPSPWL